MNNPIEPLKFDPSWKNHLPDLGKLLNDDELIHGDKAFYVLAGGPASLDDFGETEYMEQPGGLLGEF